MNLTPSQHAELADASRQRFGLTVAQRRLLDHLTAFHAEQAQMYLASQRRMATAGDQHMSDHFAALRNRHSVLADSLANEFPK